MFQQHANLGPCIESLDTLNWKEFSQIQNFQIEGKEGCWFSDKKNFVSGISKEKAKQIMSKLENIPRCRIEDWKLRYEYMYKVETDILKPKKKKTAVAPPARKKQKQNEVKLDDPTMDDCSLLALKDTTSGVVTIVEFPSTSNGPIVDDESGILIRHQIRTKLKDLVFVGKDTEKQDQKKKDHKNVVSAINVTVFHEKSIDESLLKKHVFDSLEVVRCTLTKSFFVGECFRFDVVQKWIGKRKMDVEQKQIDGTTIYEVKCECINPRMYIQNKQGDIVNTTQQSLYLIPVVSVFLKILDHYSESGMWVLTDVMQRI